jgi:hypothetical protein
MSASVLIFSRRALQPVNCAEAGDDDVQPIARQNAVDLLGVSLGRGALMFDGGIIDTLIGFPTDHRQLYEALRRRLLRDAGSQDMTMPAAGDRRRETA